MATLPGNVKGRELPLLPPPLPRSSSHSGADSSAQTSSQAENRAEMASGGVEILPWPRPQPQIIRILPFQYIHVLDLSTNVTRVEAGPQTFIQTSHERVVLGPVGMKVIPPQHYVVVKNPVLRSTENQPIFNASGQVKLAHGDSEVRFTQEPFPLFPGEEIFLDVTPLTVLKANEALRLRALQDFNNQSETHKAGEEWLFKGPGTYLPRKDVEVLGRISATVIKANQALKLRAKREMIDHDGKPRVTGEEWLVRQPGAYLPGAYEEVVQLVDAYVLTEDIAISVEASKTFVNEQGKVRKNGEKWLVKLSDTDTYIPDVYEVVNGVVHITKLTSKQFCYVLNPVGANGNPQLGQRKLVKGPVSFFLQPGERLQYQVQDNFVLSENEGLLVKATQGFKDGETERKPGDRWLVKGSTEYVPPVEVEILEKRTAIPLHQNEGIYVRNNQTGKIRAVMGQTYMLTEHEKLWEKKLPENVRKLLSPDHDLLKERAEFMAEAPRILMRDSAPFGGVAMCMAAPNTMFAQKRIDRDYVPKAPPVREVPPLAPDSEARVVTYQVPHNAAVQIYDYTDKLARVVLGPDLAVLGPDEQFTELSLSGGKPKKPNAVRTLALFLGPDFFTDVLTVETADHARLSLQVAYSWHFDLSAKADTPSKLFNVPDFVGDASKSIASRIRGAVASVTFDFFHKNSAKVINKAVFGVDTNGIVKSQLVLEQNGLVITEVDVQAVEPVDQRTHESLLRSVQLAIEITTNSQEAAARQEAERLEQAAKGKLELQVLTDKATAEKTRTEVLELKAASTATEACGMAEAEAKSRISAARIAAKGAVVEARLKAEAIRLENDAELDCLNKLRDAELQFLRETNALKVSEARERRSIEAKKFEEMVSALGSTNLRMMAVAGPEQQVNLLKALGLDATIITDGRTPLNLLSTGLGLIGTGKPGVVPA